MTLPDDLRHTFQQRYDADVAHIVRAPGRVNLIGEHTDYNDGFVLPMAIDRAVWLALTPRDDSRVHLHLLDFDSAAQFDLTSDLQPLSVPRDAQPLDYVKGMAWVLREQGYALRGFDGVLKGDVPIGAGLSSSAALLLASARALQVAADPAENQWRWQGVQMARYAQQAENQYIGVNVGIMDQMISAMGQAGSALLIDCRHVTREPLPDDALQPVPLPDDSAIVVMDTETRRSLAVGSAYNERRASCEAAAAYFRQSHLRDVSREQLDAASELDPLLLKRARHVVTENARVLQARDALQRGDAAAFGALMNASHASLHADYAVTNDALHQIVTAAQAHPACYGARMTGAGFGGCALALVALDKLAAFIAHMPGAYYAANGRYHGQYYALQPAAGASVLA